MDICLSAARAEVSRRNGAKSRGPKTPEGKARSARNALKHGLRAEKFVLLHDEDAGEFQEMAEALTADLAPVGALQAVLARRLVVAAWRLEAQAAQDEACGAPELSAPSQDELPIEPKARANPGEIAPAPGRRTPVFLDGLPCPAKRSPSTHACVPAPEVTQKCTTMRHLCDTYAPPLAGPREPGREHALDDVGGRLEGQDLKPRWSTAATKGHMNGGR
jgi:hypothetical protein